MKKINIIQLSVAVLALSISSHSFSENENRLTAGGEIVSNSIKIGNKNYKTDWYLPSEQASGIIYLQHGFSRNSKNLKDTALNFMNNGLMVMSVNVAVNGGNIDFSKTVADHFVANLFTPPKGHQMPSRVIVSGHSAGGSHVGYLGKHLVDQNFGGLVGAIMFDPVEGPNLNPYLQDMVDAGIPVYGIFANGSLCNNSGATMQDYASLTNTNFSGIMLSNGSSHVDVEGDNADFLSRLACGAPKDYNTNYNRDFSVHWALDMVNGTYTDAYYPGGTAIQALYDSSHGHLVMD